MLHNWDSGSLNFEPTCPRSLYDLQIQSMQEYLTVLEARACIEEITNIATEPEPESIPDDYYVRLITEEDREQLERFDKRYTTHCAYTLLFPEKTSGYGLFKCRKNPSIQDELIGYCILDKDVYIDGIDDFNTNVENIQKQFSNYDFSKAVLANFEQLPENKNLHQFFLEQIIQQYNQIIFLVETTPDEEYMLKSLGFQYVENEWLYLPKAIMERRVYFTCENCSYFNANSKICQNKLGPQYNYKCRPDKTCRYHHQYDIDIE